MVATRVSPVVINGQRYFPLEHPDQLPNEFGDIEHFVRSGVPVRFTHVADHTWVVHRADRPGSTGVLVADESFTGRDKFIYSAAASTDEGLPDWRIPLQRLTWEAFLTFFSSSHV